MINLVSLSNSKPITRQQKEPKNNFGVLGKDTVSFTSKKALLIESPLEKASFLSTPDEVKKILALPNINVNEQNASGNTALMNLIKYSTRPEVTEIAELHMAHPTFKINTTNDFGENLFLLAVEKPKFDIVNKILEKFGDTADINKIGYKGVTSGQTPLSVAIKYRHKGTMPQHEEGFRDIAIKLLNHPRLDLSSNNQWLKVAHELPTYTKDKEILSAFLTAMKKMLVKI